MSSANDRHSSRSSVDREVDGRQVSDLDPDLGKHSSSLGSGGEGEWKSNTVITLKVL